MASPSTAPNVRRMNRTEKAHLRRMLKDTQTYQRIRAACVHAADDVDLDEHALVIAREVLKLRAQAEAA